MSKLYGTLSQACSDTNQFSVQVNFANSISDVAEMIRQIGDITLQATNVWGKQDWVERSWLSQEMSEVSRNFSLLAICEGSIFTIIITSDRYKF
jgi:hypothetical protein